MAELTMQTPPPLSLRLREATHDLHRAAEGARFQRELVKGRLPLACYVAWLVQMQTVYTTLERHLPATGFDADPWRRTPQLERDLRHWAAGNGVAAATLTFTTQLARWAESEPWALVGVLYVLEGSTNGSRHIARVLRTAYDRSGDEGLAFLDPYGAEQPARWAAFKVQLDSVVPAEAAPALFIGAEATFRAVIAMGEELLPGG
ncbi:MAG TPA: biliverdin-producing heme oxygenase [Gemmatimonadales bacterium]|nr:biliverdin-producing heme oxygenase [Gemmatimonadales bacterium]